MVLNIALMNAIFGVIKGNLAKWWYGVTAAVTFFAMISFLLYNQESVASIAVSFGFGDVNEMVSAGAKAVIDDLRQLPDVLSKLFD